MFVYILYKIRVLILRFAVVSLFLPFFPHLSGIGTFQSTRDYTTFGEFSRLARRTKHTPPKRFPFKLTLNKNIILLSVLYYNITDVVLTFVVSNMVCEPFSIIVIETYVVQINVHVYTSLYVRIRFYRDVLRIIL